MIKHKALLKECERYKEKHGASYKWIGEQVGIRNSVFKQVRIGNTQIGIKKANQLANLLGCSLYDIWKEK